MKNKGLLIAAVGFVGVFSLVAFGGKGHGAPHAIGTGFTPGQSIVVHRPLSPSSQQQKAGKKYIDKKKKLKKKKHKSFRSNAKQKGKDKVGKLQNGVVGSSADKIFGSTL